MQDLIAVYRSLAARCDHALHLGLTEAGMGSKGIVASTAALAVLLQEGIGDTIRISLTPEPGGDRSREVIVAQEILQTMGLRAFAPMVIACPGCGRTTSTMFQELAQDIQGYVRSRMPDWRRDYPGFETLQLAVMGCIVNGPGESKHADIGISLPGTGELPAAPIFIDGKKAMTLRGEDISQQFKDIVENYVRSAGADARYFRRATMKRAASAQQVGLGAIGREGRDGFIHEAACLAPRAIQPQKVDEGRLAHALVLLRRLAERLRGRLHVEDVVGDLEGEADVVGIAPQGRRIACAHHRARLAGKAEEGARLQDWMSPDDVRKI